MQRDVILLVDDEPVVRESLVLLLDRPGRTVIVCSDVESAESVLRAQAVTHMIADVQFSGAFGYEGLHFVPRAREIRPACRIILITGQAAPDLDSEARMRGAAGVLTKPFTAAELEEALGQTVSEGGAYDVTRVPSLEEILEGDILDTALQPIVRLADPHGLPFGFEALARVRGGWLGSGAQAVFDYAARRQRLEEMNLAALRSALETASQLPSGLDVFINVDPISFEGQELVHILRSGAAQASLPLNRLVLEITERAPLASDGRAMRMIDQLREEGVRFALDDHGSAYSHLADIDRIRPTFVKIAPAFGTDFERIPTRRRIVRHVVALARDLGCRTILEGIESEATAHAAREISVDLAQGYFFGHPAPISAATEAWQLAAAVRC